MSKTLEPPVGGTEIRELVDRLVEERRRIEGLLRQVDQTLQKISGGFAKATTAGVAAGPRPSPLDQVKDVLAATADLRVANGNLSAQLIARVYGVSLSQLAGWLGRSRQAMTKTPDADSIQDELGFFERVARLRAVIPDEEFRKWLRMPTESLDGRCPLDLLAEGTRQPVADLVDDMLTGAPT